MPYHPRKSTGRGIRIALVLWIGLIATVVAFSFVYAGTNYVTFPYDNDNKIGTAFYYRSPNPVVRPAPIILFFHGYNNLKTYDFRLVEFTRRGWDVLSVDLPGHGTNPNEFTTGSWNIIYGALDYIVDNPQMWNASAIGVVGHSFGGLVCAMGLLNDARIAAGVLWAPALDLETVQERADVLFPSGHPFDRFTPADSPLTYFQSGKTLNNTLIIHGREDSTIPVQDNLDAYEVLKNNDPLNLTRYSFEEIPGENHLLYSTPVIRDTIAWFAPYLAPSYANELILEVETTPVVYVLYFALEILAIFGLFPMLFIIFVDQVGKSVERQRAKVELASGVQRDEYPLATPAINVNWKWHFLFYIIALIFIIFTGVNLLDSLPFQYQLGFMGLVLTGTVFLYEYLRHRYVQWKKGIPKRVEVAEEVADDLINPLPNRARRFTQMVILGLILGMAFLLGISALTSNFGFLFVFPVSVPYTIVSFAVSFAFSLGSEWLFRRRIQALIDEARLYYKPRTTKILNTLLIVVLPFVISIGFFRFAGGFTPAVYFLFYAVAGLCAVINWYIFDHTDSLEVTVTFSTFVMGWVLAGCMTPAFF